MSDQRTLIDLETKPANTIEDLLRVAQDASAAIEAEELTVLEELAWLRDQRFRLERVETNITIRVAAEKVDPEDSNSKPLFSNDVARKAEVSQRLSADPAYKELMAALLVAEGTQKVRQIRIERLTRDYQIAKLHIQLFIATRSEGD